MKIGHTEIFVKDLEVSRSFYVDILGFEVTVEQEGQFVWLQKEGREFLLRPGREAQPAASYQETNMAIVLYCDDLESSIRTLKDRGLEFAGQDGNEKCPTFTDPDGNWFQLVNPNDH